MLGTRASPHRRNLCFPAVSYRIAGEIARTSRGCSSTGCLPNPSPQTTVCLPLRHRSAIAMHRACAAGPPKPKARKAAPATVASQAGERTLLQRIAAFDCSDPLPMQLMRRFVAYAREHCHPQLSPDAKLVLKDFYLDLRRHSAIYRSTCITVRRPSPHSPPLPPRCIITTPSTARPHTCRRQRLVVFYPQGVPYTKSGTRSWGLRLSVCGAAAKLSRLEGKTVLRR